jgi:hypothetical protein
MSKIPTLKLPAILNVPDIDFGFFAQRWGAYLHAARRKPSRRKLREQKLAHQKARLLRPFHPQCGAKVERADTNNYNRDFGIVYLTLSNGQVVRPDKLLNRPDHNPVLREKIVAFIDSQ